MDKTENIRLRLLGLPVIQTLADFSLITRLSKYSIYQLSNHSDKYYKTCIIPKKRGGKREIDQPSKKLKGLQSWILVNILNRLKVSESCKGFEQYSSIVDNAKPHVGADTILTIDLKDFFTSIERVKVYNLFKSIGYNQTIASILTNICTFKGRLPQGSPCSPKIANLVSWKLDVRVQGYVGKRGINYTRYADDLTFSGTSSAKVARIIPVINSIIIDEGYLINVDKLRIASRGRARLVTGLVLTDESYGVGKRKYKLLRSLIYNLLKEENSKEEMIFRIKGHLAYLNSVDKKRLSKAEKYILSLTERYPNNQEFIVLKKFTKKILNN